MAGRHINDHQVRLFMTHRRNDPVALAAAKAGFSPATGYRVLQDARLRSQRQAPRGARGGLIRYQAFSKKSSCRCWRPPPVFV